MGVEKYCNFHCVQFNFTVSIQFHCFHFSKLPCKLNIFCQLQKFKKSGESVRYKNANLLLTEGEGRTGEYWLEVVAAALGPYENERGPIFHFTARGS